MTLSLVVAAMVPPATVGAAEDEEAMDFRALRDQGVHYMRRKLLPAALKSLDAAAADPKGAEDFKTRLYLARVTYKMLIVERALEEAKAALELADGDSQERSAQKILDELTSFFAGVTLTQAPEQKGKVKKGFIHLKDAGGLINKRKKEVFKKIQARFATTQVSLPTTIYLPFGRYTANLAPFEIARDETAEAVTFLDTRGEGDGLGIWWYAGGAVVLAGVTAVVIFLTMPEEEEQRIDLVSVGLGDPP